MVNWDTEGLKSHTDNRYRTASKGNCTTRENLKGDCVGGG